MTGVQKCALPILGVTNHGRLVGVITDGDLRRGMCKDLLTKTADELMTVSPHTIDVGATVEQARRMMKEHKVTSLFVQPGDNTVAIVHIHDLG